MLSKETQILDCTEQFAHTLTAKNATVTKTLSERYHESSVENCPAPIQQEIREFQPHLTNPLNGRVVAKHILCLEKL